MNQFTKLLGKDWRINRATVMGLLIMNLIAYCLGLGTYWWDNYTTVASTFYRAGHSMPYDVNAGAPLGEYMRSAAEMGVLFMVLAAAIFGGAAFALERRERSADFLAMLPVRRGRIVISKLVVPSTVLLIALAIGAAVLLYCDWFQGWRDFPDVHVAMMNFTAALLVFSIAWVLSTFTSSTAIAASAAILSTVCAGYVLVFFLRTVTPKDAAEIALFEAVILVLLGNMYYLRRVAP